MYTAKDASSKVVKFATVTNADGNEESQHRITQSALPQGAATDATMAQVRDKLDAPSAAVISGQNAGVTTAGVALGTSQVCREVLLLADAANNAAVFVGGAGGQFLPVPAATDLPLRLGVANVNVLWVKSATGTQTVNFLARL